MEKETSFKKLKAVYRCVIKWSKALQKALLKPKPFAKAFSKKPLKEYC